MLIAFNKPFGVLCQFTDATHRRAAGEGSAEAVVGAPARPTLAAFALPPKVYPAGRLDHDSEGLLLLTDDGGLAHRLTDPRHKQPKTYWVQVEGEPSAAQLADLSAGMELSDGPTLPATARCIDPPALWARNPPIRFRKTVPDAWLELTIREGRNRQVRRMTAAAGLPTLRLVRVAIGPYRLAGLEPGTWKRLSE